MLLKIQDLKPDHLGHKELTVSTLVLMIKSTTFITTQPILNLDMEGLATMHLKKLEMIILTEKKHYH